jgi:hypothetical protein
MSKPKVTNSLKKHLSICCAHEGCDSPIDVRIVQWRIPMTVNRFETVRKPVCGDCRSMNRGYWRYSEGS